MDEREAMVEAIREAIKEQERKGRDILRFIDGMGDEGAANYVADYLMARWRPQVMNLARSLVEDLRSDLHEPLESKDQRHSRIAKQISRIAAGSLRIDY
jgi:hypothetical protein